MMQGKKGLVMGVANDRSIHWGIAKKKADQDIQNLLKQLEYMGLIDSAKQEK